jgi:hypothetical protein
MQRTAKSKAKQEQKQSKEKGLRSSASLRRSATVLLGGIGVLRVAEDDYGTAPAAPERRGSAPAVTFPFSIFTADP